MTLFTSHYSSADQSKLEKQYIDSLDGVEVIKLSPDLKRRMQVITETYNSEGFRNSVTQYSDSLKQVLNIEESIASDDMQSESSDRPILFISSSIPLSVLRKYAAQLHGIGGGTMVLKGFIGGSRKMMPTLKFIASVLNVDASCGGTACEKYKVDIIIDPVLFKHHGVERVPAFMVYESKTYVERCKGSGATENASIVYGDASIKGLALELAVKDTRLTVKRFIKKAGFDK
jgi:type-F conjugative transfer system pilin assembly protein TrbC